MDTKATPVETEIRGQKFGGFRALETFAKSHEPRQLSHVPADTDAL